LSLIKRFIIETPFTENYKNAYHFPECVFVENKIRFSKTKLKFFLLQLLLYFAGRKTDHKWFHRRHDIQPNGTRQNGFNPNMQQNDTPQNDLSSNN
jgi:hypothetical protein